MNFIFLIYFFGILLACFQDVKRREVDDWLNLSIFFAGTFFLIFNNISSSFPIGSYGLFVFLIALISFLLYNARFFAGGDAKILFSLSPLFYDFFFFKSIENFLTFFVFLIFAGAIYGLGFIFVLSIKNFYSLKKEFIINFRKLVYLKYLSVLSIIFLLIGFFNFLFLSLGFFILLITFLFMLAKSLETVSFIIRKKSSDLVEGDWLGEDLLLGKNKIRSSWDGLTKKDILLIQKYKKFVLIKEGIPYAPAFLIALVSYFFRANILRVFFG